MSGKRTKRLKKTALQMVKDLKEKHNKEIKLDSLRLNNKGEPNLFRRIKKDYTANRIDKLLTPIGV